MGLFLINLQGGASRGNTGRSGGLPTEKRKFISFLKPYELENQSFNFLKAGKSLIFEKLPFRIYFYNSVVIYLQLYCVLEKIFLSL